jgi:hypothetical protein
MRIIQTEIRDIWQYLNNQLRNRGNGGGQNWSGCQSSLGDARGDRLLNSFTLSFIAEKIRFYGKW